MLYSAEAALLIHSKHIQILLLKSHRCKRGPQYILFN